MKLVYFSFFFLSFLSFISCKKNSVLCSEEDIYDSNIDTIQSNEYLVSTVGSWWKYSSNRIDSCVSYKPYTYSFSLSGDCINNDYLIKILPVLKINYTYVPILDDGKLIKYNSSHYNQKEILVSDQIGEFYNYSYKHVNGKTYISKEVIEKHSNFSIGTFVFLDVIVVSEFIKTIYSGQYSGLTTNKQYYKYYAKNIGLIMEVYQENGQTPDTIQIIEYEIAP